MNVYLLGSEVKVNDLLISVQGDPYCCEKRFESLPVGRILNQPNLIKFAKERQPLAWPLNVVAEEL